MQRLPGDSKEKNPDKAYHFGVIVDDLKFIEVTYLGKNDTLVSLEFLIIYDYILFFKGRTCRLTWRLHKELEIAHQ